MQKQCRSCKILKNKDQFSPSHFQQKNPKCKLCNATYMKDFRLKHDSTDRKRYDQSYYLQNKEKILKRKRDRYQSLFKKDKVKKTRTEVLLRRNAYYKIKRRTNINFKLRCCVSSGINFYLNKNKKSYLKYLPYSIEDLRSHLESIFEPWMNWKNHGKYNPKSWNDEDPATWTWQIDHIIPQSSFKYNSMEDVSFQECWALSNLRPYSAKDNFLEGVKRIRHPKPT